MESERKVFNVCHLHRVQRPALVTVMSSETVYRVQAKDGRGPFRPGFSRQWVIDRPDHDNLKSWIQEFGRVDQGLLVGETAGSGCRTLLQLQRWFTKEEYETLMNHGYFTVSLEASRILAESETQLVFTSNKPFNLDAVRVSLYGELCLSSCTTGHPPQDAKALSVTA